jgi:DNA-binding LacI/PurR family transcriptional regulator
MSGDFESGQFLPTVRELGDASGVSRGTAWRALKALETEGLVAAHPRHGFKVLACAADPNLGLPVAYVLAQNNIIGGWEVYYRQLTAELDRAARARGWSLMKIIATEGQEDELMQQLTGARAWGMILDSAHPALVKAASREGFPVVVMETWGTGPRLDTVVQDDFGGGRLAAQCPIDRGCERIAWFGPLGGSNHGSPRYGGASAALAAHGASFSHTVRVALGDEHLVERARELLARPGRPDAVLALWRHAAVALIQAARETGLRVGKDFRMVGWCADEIYESSYVPLFAESPAEPAVVWSTAEMVDLTLSRLVERRGRPRMPPSRTTVRTRIRMPGAT